MLPFPSMFGIQERSWRVFYLKIVVYREVLSTLKELPEYFEFLDLCYTFYKWFLIVIRNKHVKYIGKAYHIYTPKKESLYISLGSVFSIVWATFKNILTFFSMWIHIWRNHSLSDRMHNISKVINFRKESVYLHCFCSQLVQDYSSQSF